MAAKKLFLIDGSNHAFRVHFALPPMHAADGFPTRALYGFTTLFAKLLRVHQPDYCAVSFDVGKSFRVERYEEYKGHRPEMPEDLRVQWPELPKLVEAFGFPAISLEGYEADDVLGTLATRFASEEVEVYLVTGDKDFCQIVGPHVRILDLMKNAELGPEDVSDKWGVEAHQVIDALGLAGDSSDNIPGVPGVGPKRASQYLSEFGTLEGVLQAAVAKKIGGKTGQRLVEFADQARLSAELATILTDVPELRALSLEDLAPRGMQEEDLRQLFDRWDFGRVAAKLLGEAPKVDTSVYRTVSTSEDLRRLVSDLRAAGRFAFDLESTSLDPAEAAIVGMAFSWGPRDAVYVPLRHREGAQVSWMEAISAIKPLLEDPDLGKVGQNLKYDLQVCRREGIELRGIVGDTMLLDYVLMPHERRHGLDSLARRHLAHDMVSYQEVSDREQLSFDEVSVDTATRYAAEDAHVAWLVHAKLRKRLDEGQVRIYEEIELPLMPVIADMELAGVRLDLERLAEVSEDIGARAQAAEARCWEIAGRSFNVNSRHELRDILFGEMDYTPSKKVSDGWSTDSSVLEKLVGLQPGADLPATVLRFRHLTKLKGTYLDKLPTYVKADGRVHSSFNQAVAATGRLSSAEPNMQNIPIRTAEGQRIRGCFVPEEGHLLLSCDYSQVELRILAHLSGEEALVESFKEGLDIHTRTASEILGIPMDEVSLEDRTAAKAINYGLIYGMSAFRLANDLSISRKTAKEYMDSYFGRMPGVAAWLQQQKELAKKTGAAITLYGRKRLLPEIHSRQWNTRAMAERLATNTPVQGSAADIMKIAMIRVRDRLAGETSGARIVLQVHDELLVEVPEAQAERVREIVIHEMKSAADLIVPLEVNSALGEDWQEAHG